AVLFPFPAHHARDLARERNRGRRARVERATCADPRPQDRRQRGPAGAVALEERRAAAVALRALRVDRVAGRGARLLPADDPRELLALGPAADRPGRGGAGTDADRLVPR